MTAEPGFDSILEAAFQAQDVANHFARTGDHFQAADYYLTASLAFHRTGCRHSAMQTAREAVRQLGLYRPTPPANISGLVD